MTNRAVFGMRLAALDAAAIAGHVLQQPRPVSRGVGLVVTPNLDHVVRLRTDRDFAAAYWRAEIFACDGAPLHAYAALRGVAVPRATGCDIAASVMAGLPWMAWHRPFLVLDSEMVLDAARHWAARTGLGERCDFAIPPYGFASDATAAAALAQRIAAHRTTLLVMAVGSPQSEIFVDRWRCTLPPCWALCVGQAVKVALGLVRRAPAPWRRAGLEWLWRVGQEPRRLAARYARGAALFPGAVLADLRRLPPFEARDPA